MKKKSVFVGFMLVFVGLLLGGCDRDLDGYDRTVIDYENDIQYQLIEPKISPEPMASSNTVDESTQVTVQRQPPLPILIDFSWNWDTLIEGEKIPEAMRGVVALVQNYIGTPNFSQTFVEQHPIYIDHRSGMQLSYEEKNDPAKQHIQHIAGWLLNYPHHDPIKWTDFDNDGVNEIIVATHFDWPATLIYKLDENGEYYRFAEFANHFLPIEYEGVTFLFATLHPRLDTPDNGRVYLLHIRDNKIDAIVVRPSGVYQPRIGFYCQSSLHLFRPWTGCFDSWNDRAEWDSYVEEVRYREWGFRW